MAEKKATKQKFKIEWNFRTVFTALIVVVIILSLAAAVLNTLLAPVPSNEEQPENFPQGIFEDGEEEEINSEQLFDNLPVNSVTFGARQLEVIAGENPKVLVQLKTGTGRADFDEFLSDFVYPPDTEFIYYED